MGYVDTTVTLGATAYQYTFPNDQKVWLYIANQSQGALSVQLYTKEKSGGSGPINVAAGSPFVSQVTFYLLQISGNGSTFAIRIQDDKIEAGQTQTISTTQTSVVAATVTLGTSVTPVATCPAGFRWTLLRATIETNGSTTKGALWIQGSAKTNVKDYITPLAGTALPSAVTNSDLTIGQGPNNDIVIGTITLLPGDSLAGRATTAPTVVDYEFAQVPL